MQNAIEQLNIPLLKDYIVRPKSIVDNKEEVTGRHGNRYASSIEQACNQIRSKAMTIEQASNKYNVSERKLSKILKR